MTNVAYVLFKLRVQEFDEQLEPARIGTTYNWNRDNKICLHAILNALSNELYDIYCVEDYARDIWEALEKKYEIEDEGNNEDKGNKKHIIENFLDFKMTKDKSVFTQIYEF